MAGVYQAMQTGPTQAPPPSDTPYLSQPTMKNTGLIPTNVAGIVLLSAGVIVALNYMKFKFVVGVG